MSLYGIVSVTTYKSRPPNLHSVKIVFIHNLSKAKNCFFYLARFLSLKLLHLGKLDNGHTKLLLPPTLNVAFRSFEPRIGEPFPTEQLLRKKKIAATQGTIFHWETAVQFTVQKI